MWPAILSLAYSCNTESNSKNQSVFWFVTRFCPIVSYVINRPTNQRLCKSSISYYTQSHVFLLATLSLQLNSLRSLLLWIGQSATLSTAHAPSWYDSVMIVLCVWAFANAVSLLFTQKKRALHDFMGATVIVYKNS